MEKDRMEAFLYIMNYLAKTIATTSRGKSPPLDDAYKAFSPRLSARELPPSQFEKKQFSFFGFFSLFSLFLSEKKTPASQLSASVPTYKPSLGEASILLPHYLRTRDYEGLDRYLKDQLTPCMDLVDVGLKESTLTAAARQGEIKFTKKLLPYVVPKNVAASLGALAHMQPDKRAELRIEECAKELAKHIQDRGNYIAALDLNGKDKTGEDKFSPEQIHWLEKIGGIKARPTELVIVVC